MSMQPEAVSGRAAMTIETGRSSTIVDLLARLGGASTAAAMEALRRLLAAGRDDQVLGELLRAGASAPSVPDGIRMLAAAYGNLMRELALIPPLAAASFIDSLGAPIPRFPPPRTFKIDGRPVMLPARVRSASQGSAHYVVSSSAVDAILQAKEEPFRAFEIFPGQTPLAIFMIDYRESDLGRYYELGVAFFVVPRGRIAIPGMSIRVLPVNQEFTQAAGREIWGYPKTLMPHMEIAYADEEAHGTVDRRHDDVLSITVPRGGAAASRDIPFYSYTTRNKVRHCTRFIRSGREESLTLRPHVELRLGNEGSGHCLCGNGDNPCICNDLRKLGLPASPALSSWTERMSGRFEAPTPLD
jgi:Acetoacetate decarboxylase (ADC)